MRVLDQPRLMDKLHDFIKQIDEFPITAGELVELAASLSDRSVATFYQAFADDVVFSDKEDLLARSEQVGLLNSEDQPPEEFHAPEED